MFRDSPCEGHSFLAEAATMKSNPMVFTFASASVNFNDNLRTESKNDRECAEMRKDARKAGLRHNDDEAFNLPREWKPNEWYFSEDFVSRAEADGVAKGYGECG